MQLSIQGLKLFYKSILLGLLLSSLQLFFYRSSLNPLDGLFDTRKHYYQWIDALSFFHIFNLSELSFISRDSLGALEIFPSFIVLCFLLLQALLIIFSFYWHFSISQVSLSLLLRSLLSPLEKSFIFICVIFGFGYIVLVNETIRLLIAMTFSTSPVLSHLIIDSVRCFWLVHLHPIIVFSCSTFLLPYITLYKYASKILSIYSLLFIANNLFSIK